ncbi:MAG TPA: hypothetical protein VG860_10175 [Terriglobia bacterium]|nr:hypothetical protein [Terriglobia bacterium]
MPDLTAPARQPASERARRIALAVLFGAILLISRVRRWHRQPRAWLTVRIVAGLAGAGLIWRFARDGGGPASGIAGAALAAFGAFVGTRRESKTVDDVARELEALVVLNGGAFSADGSPPRREVSIFVHSERLVVLTRSFQRLAEIPLNSVREISTGPVAANGNPRAEAWELRIDREPVGRELAGRETGGRESSGLATARFRYQGAFAEHLARVAGQTIRSVWKKGLPVLRA